MKWQNRKNVQSGVKYFICCNRDGIGWSYYRWKWLDNSFLCWLVLLYVTNRLQDLWPLSGNAVWKERWTCFTRLKNRSASVPALQTPTHSFPVLHLVPSEFPFSPNDLIPYTCLPAHLLHSSPFSFSLFIPAQFYSLVALPAAFTWFCFLFDLSLPVVFTWFSAFSSRSVCLDCV